MRGPLLSGPMGSAFALQRLCALVRDSGPTVVLSSVWVASALAEEVPVTVLIEPDLRRSALRALARSARAEQKLSVVAAAEDVPLRKGGIGALVIESLSEIDEGDARAFVANLLPILRPGGLLVSLDPTKDPAVEARIAGTFLSAALCNIAQERPRQGALLTLGRARLARIPAGPGVGVDAGQLVAGK